MPTKLYFIHSEIYISCSLDQYGGPESFGRVLIESMYLKTPVISTNVGGPNNFIINEDNGLLVNPFNTTELVDAINFYRNNSNTQEIIIQNAYKTAQKYNINKTAQKLSEIII